MKKVLITIFLLTFLLPSYSANALVQAPFDGVTIESSPLNPEPLENVTVSIDSYLFDLDSASIVWLSNGVNVGHGTGMKDLIIKAPAAGNEIIITAITKNPEGRDISKSIVIKSGSIDIVWEPISYSPPFYKGKNIFTFQNRIKLVAMPHLFSSDNKELDARKLIYQWKIGGKYISGMSGYGGQSVIIDSGDVPKPLEISVEVNNKEQTADAIKKITITPSEPTIEFYEMDRLYGTLFNKALTSNISLKNSEITVFASPFGFNFKNDTPVYTWMINNIEQPDLVKNQSITLKTKDDAYGVSNIDLSIRSLKSVLQGADASFNITFSKQDSGNNATTF